MASDCIFCRIVAGEIPAAKVYEDEYGIAFLDLSPMQPGHTLIIPKVHISTLLEVPAHLDAALFSMLRTVAQAVVKATGAQGFNLLQNNGPAAGQTVFHAHWHIIPRFEGDGLRQWPQGAYENQEAMATMAARIQTALAEI